MAATAPSGGGPKALAVVAIVAALVLTLVVVVAVRLISGVGSADPAADPDPPVTTPATPSVTPSPSPTSTAPSSGELAPGGVLEVQLLPDEASQFTLQIDDPGVYQIETLSPIGVDLVLEVSSADGIVSWQEDDGGTDSPNARDAGLRLTLSTGEYTVTVREGSGAAVVLDLSVSGSDAPVIDAGEHPFEVRGGERWAGVVQVAAGDQIAVDVRADDGSGDTVLEVLLPEGVTEHNDDRPGSAPDSGNQWDPYVVVHVADDGQMVVLISGYAGEEVSGTVTITVV